jgi:hypothetical protein
VLGVLIEAFRRYRITGGIRVPAQGEIAVEDLLRRSADLPVRAVAFEGLAAERYVPLTVATVSPTSRVHVVFHSTYVLSMLTIYCQT